MGQIRPLGTAGQATNGDEGWQAYLFVRLTGNLQTALERRLPVCSQQGRVTSFPGWRMMLGCVTRVTYGDTHGR